MVKPKQPISKKLAPDRESVAMSDLGALTAKLVAVCMTGEKTVTEVELNAVLGMISYVAHTQNSREDIVGEVMTSHFGISAVGELPSRLYQKAIDYLDNLKMDEIVN